MYYLRLSLSIKKLTPIGLLKYAIFIIKKMCIRDSLLSFQNQQMFVIRGKAHLHQRFPGEKGRQNQQADYKGGKHCRKQTYPHPPVPP